MKLKMMLLLFCFLIVAAQAQGPESKPPQFDLEEYQFGLLQRGPNWAPTTEANKAELEKLQAGHMAHIGHMAKLGKLIAAGPMADNGALRGIFLFRAGTLEAARTLAAADPMLKAGRLKLELHSWWGPKGIGVKFSEEYQKNPNTPATMTKYYSALLSKGPQAKQDAQLQLAHMWNVKRMLDAKTFATAGPFSGEGALRGVFVIAAASAEEAQKIAEADPAVKAGQLAVELHPWFVAKEVWP